MSNLTQTVWEDRDCVRLSGESAKDKYPFEAMAVMSRTCLLAEMTLKKLEVKCPSDSMPISVVEDLEKSGEFNRNIGHNYSQIPATIADFKI